MPDSVWTAATVPAATALASSPNASLMESLMNSLSPLVGRYSMVKRRKLKSKATCESGSS